MDFQMADTQFYVTIGILTAVAAIVSSEVRDSGSQRSVGKATNAAALLLLAGVWTNALQIWLVMAHQSNYESMSKWDVVHFVAHSLSLAIMATLVCLWYMSIATHRETPEGMPTEPMHTNQQEP